MSVRYEPIIDEVSSEDRYVGHPQVYFMQQSNRGKRWPKAIGIAQIINGMLITFLGLMEVFIVPIAESPTTTVQFNKSTCYGAGIFAGVIMVLTGSTAARASLSKRDTTVYRFYNLTILTLLLYIGFTIFLIIAYAKGWTTQDAYPPHSRMHQVHMFVTIFVVLGLMFALTAFIQYYDAVCCGEMKLWERWLRCLCFICWGRIYILSRRRANEPDDELMIQ